MDYKKARAIKIKIIGIVQEWAEANGLEVSGAGAAELAEEIFNEVKVPLQQKPTVTKEWVEDLRDLFFDWEHSQEEPVDRSGDQKSTDEIWEEIVETFGKRGVMVEK